MAKQPASGIRIYVDEFDFSGSLNGTSQEIEQETAVVTAFADAGPRRVVGNYDAKHGELGLFEPTDDGYDEQVFALLNDADDHFLTKLLAGTVIGSLAYDSVVRLSKQPRSVQAGGAVLLHLDAEGSNGVARGIVLGNKISTGAENLAGQNQGTTPANSTYAAVFRVLAFTGTDVTLAVQESQNDGSPDAYATISGLTNTFTGIGVSRKTTAAATEAWKRLAITGTFTSATILVTAGRVQGT